MTEAVDAPYDQRLLDAAFAAAHAWAKFHSTTHGPEHWGRVAATGLRLAAATPGADVEVVKVFALLHDAMRESDGHGPGHGSRAAKLAKNLRPLLDAVLAEATKAASNVHGALLAQTGLSP